MRRMYHYARGCDISAGTPHRRSVGEWAPFRVRDADAGLCRGRETTFPRPQHRDACTVTFSWFASTFEMLPDVPSEKLVVRHAQAYIMMLLSTALFGDKTIARVHLRRLPSVDPG
ncbi:hypothetical protein PIB30_102993 [Stylosanthes scabra]|uniref:Uncharacterized protein n=1 Tax=Stylosanthes scabra TaxID=79078 RepID=A0ABU6XWU5_9FABA|nr:hypothetical protein [Stylosanthes scabra]